MRYALFGDNRLTTFGIRLAAFMLPLQNIFEFCTFGIPLTESGLPLSFQ